MPQSSVPELQQKLFKRMGIDFPEQRQGRNQNTNGRKPTNQFATRKEQRKAQRVQKKAHQYANNRHPPRPSAPPQRRPPSTREKDEEQERIKSILKSRADSQNTVRIVNPALEDDSLDEDDFDQDSDASGLEDEEVYSHDSDKEDSGDGREDSGNGKVEDLTQAQRDKLAQDDAVIADFEKKLGIKKGRKKLPQSFKDDGLDTLMGFDEDGEDDEEEEESDIEARKRKHDYDDWLSAKRRKTNSAEASSSKWRSAGFDNKEDSLMGGSDDEDVDLDDEDSDHGGLSGDDFGDDSFEGFESDQDDDASAAPRQRENPYVAPINGQVVAKYVPPSLRKASGAEDENRTRLRKQVQGLVNRLTDANILSIVQAMEELYQKNPRGDVTEAITDTVIAQVWKPESLPDQFFVLTGGLCAATYRIIGASFGSHLVRRIVKDFGDEYDKAKVVQGEDFAIPKESSNLLALLVELYVLDAVTCKIIFDFMERLLSDLTEINVELLLRICRMAGRLLKRDDSQSLKHVSSVLGKAVAKVGYNNVSVRTKFMIETINDLKNSKTKAKGMDSAVLSEHVLRMKKRLGDLKSQSRRLDGMAPMGISLDDVENADVRGKWWLVGASVPVKSEDESATKPKHVDSKGSSQASMADNEDMDFVLPDYPKKARSQGLATPTQIAIFTALLSASDAEAGYRQFVDLKLKKDEQIEIARVLVQCVGSEATYNPYYAFVAQQACSNRKIRFAFQNRLWHIFRGLGESLFGEEADYEETAEGERMKDGRRTSNVAQFYSALLIDGSLSMTVFKPLELPKINSWTSTFMEWLIVSLLKGCRSKDQGKEDTRLGKVFRDVQELPALAAGLHWFLRKRVRKTKVISSREMSKLEDIRLKVQELVQGGQNED
jgi:nucleolar MIF4G domain-containing protein 1